MDKPDITPKIRVGTLLEAYPHLLEVLTGFSPVFARLRNPVLFRTVARVATLQQVAVTGGVRLDELIATLREAAGQAPLSFAEGDELLPPPPGWAEKHRLKTIYDAGPVINRGDSPMASILREAQSLGKGELLCVDAPFVPAPVISLLKEKGYTVYSGKQDHFFRTWIALPD
ncbi:MAG: DUF1858 domain-containing protein [Bacteroidota bacterium]